MLPLTAYARDCVGASGVSPCSTCQARQFSVCASLTEDGLKRLAASARTYHFAAGRTLVEQGEPAADLFNLTAGAARISRDLPDGRRQIVGFLYAGAWWGRARRATTASRWRPSRTSPPAGSARRTTSG